LASKPLLLRELLLGLPRQELQAFALWSLVAVEVEGDTPVREEYQTTVLAAVVELCVTQTIFL
jgi:hypothetical protein